jgi:hypothetical protein
VYKLLLVGLLSLPGCTSLPQKVSSIAQGTPKQEVLAKLGSPDTFVNNSDGSYVMAYRSKGNVCALGFVADLMQTSACEKDPNYIGPVAGFFKGFSEGYNASQASRVRTTCVTNNNITTCN